MKGKMRTSSDVASILQTQLIRLGFRVTVKGAGFEGKAIENTIGICGLSLICGSLLGALT